MDNQTSHTGVNMNTTPNFSAVVNKKSKIPVKSSEEIRDEIQQTKDDIAETASEIGKRLKPSNVVKNYVDGSGVIHFVKRHPISLSVFAVGTALYFVERKKQINVSTDIHAIHHKLSEMHDSVSDKAANIYQSLTEKTEEAKEKMSSASEKIKDAAQSGVLQTKQMYNASPLLFGGLALLAGVALGWAIPISEREKRLMGDKSKEFFGKAKEVFQEKKDDAKIFVNQNLGMHL